MSRPFLSGLAVLCLLPASARADDPPPEGCEPLTPASIEVVSARFELDEEQTAWLASRFAAGALHHPEDLAGLPGAGPELLAALEGAWCWGSGTKRLAQVAASYREAPRVETRVRVAATWLEGEARTLTETGRRSLLRGGARARAGPWSLRGGTLAARRGLGLLLASAGAEARGTGPRTLRGGGWRTTTALDSRVLVGGALAWERAGFAVELAEGREAEPPATRPAHRARTVFVSWMGREHTGGAQILRAENGWSHGVYLGTRRGPGSWAAEAAWSGEGSAQGVSWFLDADSWKVRAGLRREGAGFLRPGDTPPASLEDLVVWDLEAIWRGGPSRFLRAAARSEREPERGREFARGDDRTVEVGERLRPGLSVVLSWRDRREAALVLADAWRETTWRSEIRWERRPWTVRARHEDRRTAAALARNTDLRVGRRGRLEWEGRAGFLSREGDTLVLWGYARRAGGLYGWDVLRTGARLGVWAGLDAGGFRFEASVDAVPDGLRAAASLGWRGGVRGALDPLPGPS